MPNSSKRGLIDFWTSQSTFAAERLFDAVNRRETHKKNSVRLYVPEENS